jgi:hypothetical protein
MVSRSAHAVKTSSAAGLAGSEDDVVRQWARTCVVKERVASPRLRWTGCLYATAFTTAVAQAAQDSVTVAGR